ncbi:MAG: hypothetical protein HOQ24_04560 [Mycobacteriaceae bacterium]|nr:hypothetical protein [Mycobacteriaceae bacterium]
MTQPPYGGDNPWGPPQQPQGQQPGWPGEQQPGWPGQVQPSQQQPYEYGQSYVPGGQPPQGPPPGGQWEPPGGGPKSNSGTIAAIVIAALAVVIAAVVVIVVMNKGDDKSDSQASSSSSATSTSRHSSSTTRSRSSAPTTTSSTDDKTYNLDQLARMKVGDCFNESASGNFSKTSCTSPHTDQIFAKLTSKASTATGAADDAKTQCSEDANQTRIRKSALPDDAGVVMYYPLEASWDSGDRQVFCAIEAGASKFSSSFVD